jgi:PHD/YefM family antitoxin component YafN of YafNO toxin-antitoxin module
MSISTFSAREFNQQLGKAKKLAHSGPVFVTDRGRQTHVLLDVDEYRKITHTGKSIGELLSCPEAAEIDFELPVREIQEFREVDFD